MNANVALSHFASCKTSLIGVKFYLSNIGKSIWDHIKQEAADAFNPPAHGGSEFLQALNDHYASDPNLHVTLVGHSAGSIYICQLLQHADEVLPPQVTFDVIFLAPAYTDKLFADTLTACKDRIRSIRVFAMSDQLEQADVIVPGIYTRSLLYMVSGLFEDAPDTPILGMQRFFSNNAPKSGLFQEVVLFMDCCRNESLINFPLSLPSWGVSAGTGNTNTTRAKKFYGFATRWSKKARELPIDGMMQGVFTWSLLKALRGDVTDSTGRVTEQALKGSIYNSVRKLLANNQMPAEGDDGWVFAQLASKQAPSAAVQIDLSQLSPNTSVELIDASHTTLEKHMPNDGPWQIRLSLGLYLLSVPSSGQKKFFDVTGSDLISVSLDTLPVAETTPTNTKIHLIANSDDPAIEIFVIDSHFQRITRGHGHLEADLA